MKFKSYAVLKEELNGTVNQLLTKYAFFAFSDEQFKEGLQRFGLTEAPEDLAKLGRIPGGGFMLREHIPELAEAMKATSAEIKARAADPETGYKFLYSAFYLELANHEYSWTLDPAEALGALGMDPEEVEANETARQALKDACRAVIKDSF